jgi:hypothetical protein
LNAGAGRLRRFPVFYGWVLVATAFVTIGIVVNARTAFSLFFPSILDEFGWSRALTAATFDGAPRIECLRPHRELRAGVLDRDRVQRGVGGRHVAGGASESAARRRSRPTMRRNNP